MKITNSGMARLFWIASLFLIVAGANALSPSDEAAMAEGLRMQYTNANSGLDLIGGVVAKPEYTAEDWTEFYSRYYSTNLFNYGRRAGNYWRAWPSHGWSSAETALKQQVALHAVATNRLGRLYSEHPTGLGTYLASLTDGEREDLMSWNNELNYLGTHPAPGMAPDAQIHGWILSLIDAHPEYLGFGKYIDWNKEPYVNDFRDQFHLTVRDMMELAGRTREEIADLFALEGARRRLFVDHGQLLMDNYFANARDLNFYEAFLHEVPAHLSLVPTLLGYHVSGDIANLNLTFLGERQWKGDIHIGDEPSWLKPDWERGLWGDWAIVSYVTGAFQGSRFDWLDENGILERAAGLVSLAGENADNYLYGNTVRSDPTYYDGYTFGLLHDLNAVCVLDTPEGLKSAVRRVSLENNFHPLAQFLLWLDIWSELGDTAKSLVIDKTGTVSASAIPITRDAEGRIETFQVSDQHWKVGYASLLEPNQLLLLDATALSVVSSGMLGQPGIISVVFNKPMPRQSAESAANYVCSLGLPNEIRLLDDLKTVELVFEAFAGLEASLTISGVEDFAGVSLPTTVLMLTPQFEVADVSVKEMLPPSRVNVTGPGQLRIETGGYSAGFFAEDEELCFAYQGAAGDFDARVRIDELHGFEGGGRGGLMVRESLSPMTSYASAFALGDREIGAPEYSSTYYMEESGSQFVEEFPFAHNLSPFHDQSWLRLIRQGNYFSSLVSMDGEEWQPIGRVRMELAEEAIVGVAASAGNYGRSETVSVQFSEFSVGAANDTLAWLSFGDIDFGVKSKPYAMMEAAGSKIYVRILLSQPATSALTLKLAITGGAANGADYVAVPQEIVLPANSAEARIGIAVLDDEISEGSEILRIALEGGPGYEAVGEPLNVTILDDEDRTGGLSTYIYSEYAAYWEDVTGGMNIGRFFSGSSYRNDFISAFERSNDHYGSPARRMAGFLVPPESGEFRFYIASRGPAELYLSTDETPANRRIIAGTEEGTDYREFSNWDEFGNRSDSIRLEGGKRYFIELLHLSETASVGWQQTVEGGLADGAEPIPGRYLEHLAEVLPLEPAAWVRWDEDFGGNGNWYGLTRSRRSWPEADYFARREPGRHMASITTMDEQVFVWNAFWEVFWIGLTDVEKEGEFRWTSGEPLDFTFWHSGEPRDWEQDEHFVSFGRMWRPGEWVNLVEDQSEYALLEQAAKPAFSAGQIQVSEFPKSTDVSVGADASFEVEVQGPVQIQWYHNGEPLMDQTNAVLQIGRAGLSNAGVYEVGIEGGDFFFGSPPVMLHVTLLPIVRDQPGSRLLEAGEPLEICVEGEGENLQYQWRKNGMNLEGATNSCFRLDAVKLSDGGSYSVLIRNDHGIVESEPAVVTIDVPFLDFQDDFGRSTPREETEFEGRGTNIGATFQGGEGERPHAGKAGTNSVWMAWKAGSNGKATFSTVGSSFDTLLAVYQGENLATLTQVASDEDSGAFLTSQVQFNAQEGQIYHIAVAGFFHDEGEIGMSWKLEPSQVEIPVIKTPPTALTSEPGGVAEFQVQAENAAGLSYQWFFNDDPIEGARTERYLIPNVSIGHVGKYSVQLRNDDGEEIKSVPVSLDMCEQTSARMEDKWQDLLPTAELERQAGAGGSRGVVVGSLARVPFATSTYADGTELTGLQLCDTFFGGADKFAKIEVESSGVLEIALEPSTVPAALVLRSWVGAAIKPFLACGYQAFGGGISKVLHPVTQGETLLVQVITERASACEMTFQVIAPVAEVGILDNGRFYFKNLQKYGVYEISQTTDWRNWTPVWSGLVTSGELDFMAGAPDPNGSSFYRIRKIADEP